MSQGKEPIADSTAVETGAEEQKLDSAAVEETVAEEQTPDAVAAENAVEEQNSDSVAEEAVTEEQPSEAAEAEEPAAEEAATEEQPAETEAETPAAEEAAAATQNQPKKRPVSRAEMTRRQYIWNEMKKNKVAYLMVGPFMILFFIFTVLPVFLSLILSLTDFNMLQMPHFKGLSNFQRLILDDEIFLIACKNTLIFAAITGPVSYFMALLIAWFINELPPKIRALVTLVFYAPSISGSIYLIWQTLFSSDSYGWANAMLIKMGAINTPILWFSDAKYVMGLCIVVALWTSLGTAFLSFIAGLQTIDRSLYEAAAVDGIKNRWQELWYVTLPTMKPQLMFGAVLSITQSFGFGAIVTALCGFPSVDYAAHTIMHHLDDYGGQRYEVGYASAIAVILFIIMITCNMVIKKALSKVGQ